MNWGEKKWRRAKIIQKMRQINRIEKKNGSNRENLQPERVKMNFRDKEEEKCEEILKFQNLKNRNFLIQKMRND